MSKDYTKYGKKVAEVKVDTIEEATNVVEEVKKEAVFGVVVDCAKLNIRSKADAKAPIISTVNKDTKLRITNEEIVNGFYSVCTETGMDGFCVAKYVKVEK